MHSHAHGWIAQQLCGTFTRQSSFEPLPFPPGVIPQTVISHPIDVANRSRLSLATHGAAQSGTAITPR